MILSNQSSAAFHIRLLLIIAVAGWLAFSLSGLQTHWNAPALGAAVQTPALVNSFSAASYGTTVTPEGIAAAFGASLAPSTARAATLPLPTTLNGVSLMVGGRAAGLFFVSTGQINYLVPPETAPGEAEVVVRANNVVTHTGRITIANAAPALFTFSGNGLGVPAATALRVVGNTQRSEPVMQRDESGAPVPRPLNLGPVGEKVFLILSLAGIRRLPNSDANGGNGAAENVRVLLGGLELTPTFAGAAPGFAGLDQINVELPRTLIGRGRIKLAVLAGGLASNEVELEIAPAAASGPSPLVTSFAPTAITAGEALTIQGGNFGALAQENTALIGGNESRTFDAVAPNQLTVRVPYGAESGAVAVRTAQGEGAGPGRISLLTSASGFVEDTKLPANRLPGVKVKIATVTATSNNEGAFLLRNPPVSEAQLIEIDPTELPLTPKLDKLIVKRQVSGARDNHLGPIPLQAIIGPGILLGASSGAAQFAAARLAPAASITTGGVTLEVADNVSATFPGGATRGVVYLSVIENSRTPAELPPGVFSSTIAQLTPFGVKLNPGGKLIFQNADRLPANSTARLYKFDQTPGSRTIGEFIDVGAATVSADGQRVETAPNAITETSIYFAARPSPVTTVLGRVVDSDGVTPVRRVSVRTRGQEAFSDGSGGFVLRNVPVGADNLLNIEASYERPNGRIDRVQRNGVAAVVNGLTRVIPDLVLPAPPPNRPPTLIAPTALELTEGLVRSFGLVVSDPDPGQTIAEVTVTGAPFATIVANQGAYALRLAPGAGTAGAYMLTVRATDSQNASTPRAVDVRIFANRAPVLTVPGAQTATVGQQLAFTVLAADPDDGQILTLTATDLPSGAAFSQTSATTGRFTWTPAANQVGAFTVSFAVADNGSPPLRDMRTVTITVVLGWTRTNGPNGGVILALLASGGNLFAGTENGGIFRSTDNGANWTPINNRLFIYSICSLAMNGTTLFAGVCTGGIFRSTDNGENWTPVNNGLGIGRVLSFVTSGTSLFAGISGDGIYRTTDNGDNWTPVNNGLGSQVVYSLAVSGTALFAGTFRSGVYRSDNGGNSWTAVNTGLGNLSVQSLVVSNMTLFAGTERGVYYTINNGANWTPASNGLGSRDVRALAVSGTTLFAGTGINFPSGGGVFRSIDNGANWTPVNNGLGDQFILSLAVSGMALFAGTAGSGVYRTTDSGANWIPVNNGLSSQSVGSLAVSGTSVFVGTTFNGVFRMTDNGANWTPVNNGLGSPFVHSLAVSGTTLFAGTDSAAVYRTTDSGENWTQVNNGLGNQTVYSLVVSGTTVFAGTRERGIYRTMDSGANWTPVNNGLGNQDVRALAMSGTIVFAGTGGSGVYRTTDNGENWTPVNNGLSNHFVRSLAVSGTTVFAGTGGSGVYRTMDNGANWTQVNNGLSNRSILSLAVSGATVFAGTEGGGVFRTIDNGANWTAFNEGLTNLIVPSLAISGGNLFAGTYASSVFIRPLP